MAINSNITLKKMSSILGISISTISRALKDHPDISDATKQRVRELAGTMEYEPNAHAINLRASKSRVIGLIVPEISNFFYDSLLSSLEEETRLHGYSLIILQSNDNPETERENIRLCKQGMVAGLFISLTKHTTDISSILKLQEHGIPVIFLDKVPADESCNRISMDDEHAAILAAEALAHAGKRNILALFGNHSMSISTLRQNAFEQYFKRNTELSPCKIMILEADSSQQAYEYSLKALMYNRKYDAIFCMSDEILTGVMKTVQRLELKLPADIGLVAISNGTMPGYYYPEITYVETSGAKLGKLAYNRMMASLAGSTFIQNLKVETRLVQGGSL